MVGDGPAGPPAEAAAGAGACFSARRLFRVGASIAGMLRPARAMRISLKVIAANRRRTGLDRTELPEARLGVIGLCARAEPADVEAYARAGISSFAIELRWAADYPRPSMDSCRHSQPRRLQAGLDAAAEYGRAFPMNDDGAP